jgi:hypothetical protein
MGLKEDSDSAMYFPKYLSECNESTKQVLESEEVSEPDYMSEIEKSTFRYFKNSEYEDRNESDSLFE